MCRCGWSTCGDGDAAEAAVVTRAMNWVAVGVVVHHLQVVDVLLVKKKNT